jgi:tRNA(Ile)-lysidine synthase
VIELRVKDTIIRYRMLDPGDRVLVAVSGGPDSVALLAILQTLAPGLDLDLHVAHLDHGWRGRAGQRDAEFVRRLALRRGLPVSVGHIGRTAWAAAGRRLSSREARAREFRNAFLLDAAREIGARRVALGHTRDDQAESLLLRLLRGSGARGLAGIYPVVDGLFVRPLIEIRRGDLLAYLKERGLAYRIDATNRDTRLTRNRIRRRLIPMLERDYNPAVVETLAQTADLLRDEDEVLTRLAAAQAARMVRPEGRGAAIPVAALAALPPAVQRRVLRGTIAQVRGGLHGITLLHVERSRALLAPGAGRGSVCLPDGVVVRRRGDDLLVTAPAGSATTRAPAADAPAAAPGCVEALCPVPGEVTLEGLGLRLRARIVDRGAAPADLRAAGRERAYLDADLVRTPLLIRPRRPGDRFVPLGAPGTRKVKAFLIDRKVPVDDRGRIPLVLSGERIAWIVDHAIDDHFKVTDRTRRVLVLEREAR